MTFLAALRCNRIDAPCVFDGPINGESFKAYVEQILTPTLKPGDVVVLDNLGSHKSSAVPQMVRARRCCPFTEEGTCLFLRTDGCFSSPRTPASLSGPERPRVFALIASSLSAIQSSAP